jgi:hypothetical protein
MGQMITTARGFVPVRSPHPVICDNSFVNSADHAHTVQVHLSTFDIVASSVSEYWPMFSMLSPTYQPDIHGALAIGGCKGKAPEADPARISTVGATSQLPRDTLAFDVNEDITEESSLLGKRMPIDSAPCVGHARIPLSSHGSSNVDDGMDVDDEGGNATLLDNPPLRRSGRNIKSRSGEPDQGQADDHTQALHSSSRPAKQSKRKVVVKTEDKNLFPRVIGSKYIQYSFIDLTQIEVSQDRCLFNTINSFSVKSALPRLSTLLVFPL